MTPLYVALISFIISFIAGYWYGRSDRKRASKALDFKQRRQAALRQTSREYFK